MPFWHFNCVFVVGGQRSDANAKDMVATQSPNDETGTLFIFHKCIISYFSFSMSHFPQTYSDPFLFSAFSL